MIKKMTMIFVIFLLTFCQITWAASQTKISASTIPGPLLISSVGSVSTDLSSFASNPSSGVSSLLPTPQLLWANYAAGGPGGTTFTQVKVEDLDGDGTKEIIGAVVDSGVFSSVLNPQGIYVWDSAGNIKAGFPIYPPTLQFLNQTGYITIAGIGNVMGTAAKEIIVAGGRNLSLTGGGIFVISHTGQILDHILPNIQIANFESGAPMLNDLNGDGKDEIIFIGRTFIPGVHPIHRIYVYTHNGLGFVPFSSNWPHTYLLSEQLTGNALLTDQGQKSIIALSMYYIPSSSYLYPFRLNAFRPDGTLRWSSTINTNDSPYGPPLIGDINGDFHEDIIILTKDMFTSVKKIYIYNAQGIMMSNWTLPNLGQNPSVYTNAQEIIVGDLDKDRRDEIAILSQGTIASTLVCNVQLWVFDAMTGQPRPGFPVPINSPYEIADGLGIADIDNDSFPDLYLKGLNGFRTGLINDHQYALLAFDRNGMPLANYNPLPLLNYQNIPPNIYSYESFQTITFSDPNQDGLGDFIIPTGWGSIQGITTNAGYRKRSTCWSEAHGNNKNTRLANRCK